MSIIPQNGSVECTVMPGIFHSEYNLNKDKEVKFLQIWIFPDRKNVTPRYDQISLSDVEKENEFYQILSPNPDDEGVWIYQQAWFHMGKFTEKKSISYQLKNKNDEDYISSNEPCSGW
jgi:hypothetical protein